MPARREPGSALGAAIIEATDLGPQSPARKCQYPLWGNGKPTHEYCDAPIDAGWPYCPTHVELCYRHLDTKYVPNKLTKQRAGRLQFLSGRPIQTKS